MINRVVLAGRLTKDVEVRKTNTGLSVASFTVAIDRNTRNQDGSRQADFINCVAWRQSADFLGQYAGKGAMVGVDGRLQTRSYDRNDGTKAYVTEVVCDSVSILESKATSQNRMMNQNNNYGNNSYANNNSFNNGGFGGGYDNSYNQMPNNPVGSMPTSANSSNDNNDFGNAGLDISSDDLPF